MRAAACTTSSAYCRTRWSATEFANLSPSRRWAAEPASRSSPRRCPNDFRVPVITSGQPELTAAIGGGLRRPRHVERGPTACRSRADAWHAAVAARRPDRDDARSGTRRRARMVGRRRRSRRGADRSVRLRPRRPTRAVWTMRDPRCSSSIEPQEHERAAPPLAWYRRPEAVMGAGVVVVLVAPGGGRAVRDAQRRKPSGARRRPPSTTTAPPPTSAAPAQPETQAPPPETVTQEAPPPVTQTVTAPPPPPEATEPPPPTTAAEPPPHAADHRAAPPTPDARAAARRTDAAVRDHSRSAVRSGTDSTATWLRGQPARSPRLRAMTADGRLALRSEHLRPAAVRRRDPAAAARDHRLLRGPGQEAHPRRRPDRAVARRVRRVRQAGEAVRDVPDAVGVRRRQPGQALGRRAQRRAGRDPRLLRADLLVHRAGHHPGARADLAEREQGRQAARPPTTSRPGR